MSRRQIARQFIRKAGQSVTITRTPTSAFDPIDSEIDTEGTVQTVTTKGLVRNFNDEQIDGVEVQRNDVRLDVPHSDFDGAFLPRDGDTVTLDGKNYRIRRVRLFDFDKIIWLQLRGGATA